MGTTGTLSPTAYAILGLLAIKPWTTYELAKQVDQTLNRFWPRARSKLYEEPKRLAEQGLATASPGTHGRRPRTVYAITPRGRRALAAWLAAGSAPPVFESEHVLKVFYAEHGTTADLRGTLDELRAWVRKLSVQNVEVGSRYVAGMGTYPERLPTLVLTSRFLDDYLEMIDRWAQWARERVDDWPDDPAEATADLASLTETVEQAQRRIARTADPDRDARH